MTREEALETVDLSIKKAKEERVNTGFKKLEDLKKLSLNLSKVVLESENALSEKEIETLLALLKIDLHMLLKKTEAEIEFDQKKAYILFKYFRD